MFWECRLRALKQAPTAFLVTLDEEKAQGPSRFEKTLTHEGNEHSLFGAIVDEPSRKIVATSGIFHEEKTKLRHKATIYGFFVDEDQRGKGVGGKLLDLTIQFAREEMKVSTIYLNVESTNLPAIKLYESRDFKMWGTEPKSEKEGDKFFDTSHMTLIL